MSRERVMMAVLGCLFILVPIPVIALADAWAASVLWRWFVVSQFGLPALSVLSAYGMALTARMLSGSSASSGNEKADGKDAVNKAIGSIIGRLLVAPLIVGVVWIVKSIM